MAAINAPKTCTIKNNFMRNTKHPNRVCRDAKRFSFKARLQVMIKPDLLLRHLLSPWFHNQPKLPRKPNLLVADHVSSLVILYHFGVSAHTCTPKIRSEVFGRASAL